MIPASYLFKDAYDRAWRDRRRAWSGPGRQLFAWLRRLAGHHRRPGADPIRRRSPAE